MIGVRPKTAPGLGLALTEVALEALADRGVPEVKCYVNANFHAMRRVVRRVGFEPLGEIAVHDGAPCLVCVYRFPSVERAEVVEG